jgi:hypothetical protein
VLLCQYVPSTYFMFDLLHLCCRYVSLKRRLLVDPHLPKEEARSSNLIVDNPLSQNPGI